jgi:hypothetical protein
VLVAGGLAIESEVHARSLGADCRAADLDEFLAILDQARREDRRIGQAP